MVHYPPGSHCNPTRPIWYYYFIIFVSFWVLNPKKLKSVGRGNFFHFPSQSVSLSLFSDRPFVLHRPASLSPDLLLRQRILLLRQHVRVSYLQRYSTSWYSLSSIFMRILWWVILLGFDLVWGGKIGFLLVGVGDFLGFDCWMVLVKVLVRTKKTYA
jgi:hypothetical protein